MSRGYLKGLVGESVNIVLATAPDEAAARNRECADLLALELPERPLHTSK